ncbi:hypothetical protein X975_02541, partial [Stegodyphus mimosarum]
ASDDHTSLPDVEDDDQLQTCDSCKLQFDNISDFLDHLNQECMK